MPNRFRHIAPLLCLACFGCSEGAPQTNKTSSAIQGTAGDTLATRRANNDTVGTPPADTTSLRLFVQSFYDWYVPVAHQSNGSPPWYRVLQSRDSILNSDLALGMRADSTERAASSESATRLNFDPFLASQDPCERYAVGKIQQKKGSYSIIVNAVCSSAYKMPDVVAEVERVGQSWQFVNFFYDGADLKQLLCQDVTERAHDAKLSASMHCGGH